MNIRMISAARHLKGFGLFLSFMPFAFALTSCSSASKWFGSFSGQEPATSVGAAGGPGGGSSSTTSNDEKEQPTIEVAGVNLTSICWNLAPSLRVPDHTAVRCEIKSDLESETELKAANMSLKSSAGGLSFPSVGITGTKATAASTWIISKVASLTVEFDVPNAEMPIMLKYPVLLTMEGASLNSVPVVDTPVFRPVMGQYFATDPSCSNAVSQDVTLMIVPPLPGLVGASTQITGYESNLQLYNFGGVSLDAGSKICGLQFVDDIEFTWSSTPGANFRVAGTVGSMDNLMFSEFSDTEKVFGFPMNFMIGTMNPSGLLMKTRMDNAGSLPAGDSPSNWCPLGLKDCLSRIGSDQTIKIHLTKLAPSFLSKHAQSILFGTDASQGINIRIHGYQAFAPDLFLKISDPAGICALCSSGLFNGPGPGSVRGKVKYLPPQ
ncbi:MAG: hypothetical protein ACO3A4_10200 [Silvanigrellaceae bacterium]